MFNLSQYLNRDSGIETLRIFSILGILAVHSDFFALGAPDTETCRMDPLTSFWRYIIESVTIVSVDIFVLISGWFTIRPRRERLMEFLFQILFFNVMFFLAFAIMFPESTITKAGIESLFMLDKRFWFVKAYLLLYFLSPVLNSFSDLPRNKQSLILVGFYLFQTIYGWYYPAVVWFNEGYSAISFVGLYLLAQYLRRLHEMRVGGAFLRSKIILIAIFAAFVLANSFAAFGYCYTGRVEPAPLYAYNSPFVILAAVSVFLVFAQIHFRNKWINYIAISSFAAFLLHANHFFVDGIFVPWIRRWFDLGTLWVFSIKTSLFISVLFLVAIAIDKVRIFIWKKLWYNCIAR